MPHTRHHSNQPSDITVLQGARAAQSLKGPTFAQLMSSRFMSSNPASNSADSSEPWSLLQILCLPLSLPLSSSHSVSLSVSKIDIKKKKGITVLQLLCHGYHNALE